MRDMLPEASPPLGGRGFTLLNVNNLKRVMLNLLNSTCTMAIFQSLLFNRVKGRGAKSSSSCPPHPYPPPSKGEGNIGDGLIVESKYIKREVIL
jgi:hypothetical protein